MTKVEADTVLQRVPDLNIHLDSSNTLRITMDGQVIGCGRHGLAILDAFGRPTPLSEALLRLHPRIGGLEDERDLADTIEALRGAGILQDATRGTGIARADRGGFGSPKFHIAMLNDRSRTAAYLAAIGEVVRPGDVVVDIGTGTGVLAVAAARAGARHVYAIEASGIADVTRAVLAANDVADRVTLLRGWSTQLDLPETADVLVSEIIGDDPLEENVLGVTGDAVVRLLKPRARLVPARLRILGLPVALPPEVQEERTVPANLRRWHSWYGIDFRPLAVAAERLPYAFPIAPHAARHWPSLSDPVVLADLDLGTARPGPLGRTVTATATARGPLEAVLVFFELELGPTTRFSTHPLEAGPASSWRSFVWLCPAAGDLAPGDPFAITYAHDATGPQIAVRRVSSVRDVDHRLLT
ncbi:MAG TPA: 50S ribosomal protein L11 methyltransferase [Methylomirabilota bacterium]